MKVSNLISQRLVRMKKDISGLVEFADSKRKEIEKISDMGETLIKEMETITDDKKMANNIKYISLNEKVSEIHKQKNKIK